MWHDAVLVAGQGPAHRGAFPGGAVAGRPLRPARARPPRPSPSGPTRPRCATPPPGIFWVALLFSTVLAIQRSVAVESGEGTRDGLRLSGIDPAGHLPGQGGRRRPAAAAPAGRPVGRRHVPLRRPGARRAGWPWSPACWPPSAWPAPASSTAPCRPASACATRCCRCWCCPSSHPSCWPAPRPGRPRWTATPPRGRSGSKILVPFAVDLPRGGRRRSTDPCRRRRERPRPDPTSALGSPCARLVLRRRSPSRVTVWLGPVDDAARRRPGRTWPGCSTSTPPSPPWRCTGSASWPPGAACSICGRARARSSGTGSPPPRSRWAPCSAGAHPGDRLALGPARLGRLVDLGRPAHLDRAAPAARDRLPGAAPRAGRPGRPGPPLCGGRAAHRDRHPDRALLGRLVEHPAPGRHRPRSGVPDPRLGLMSWTFLLGFLAFSLIKNCGDLSRPMHSSPFDIRSFPGQTAYRASPGWRMRERNLSPRNNRQEGMLLIISCVEPCFRELGPAFFQGIDDFSDARRQLPHFVRRCGGADESAEVAFLKAGLDFLHGFARN